LIMGRLGKPRTVIKVGMIGPWRVHHLGVFYILWICPSTSRMASRVVCGRRRAPFDRTRINVVWGGRHMFQRVNRVPLTKAISEMGSEDDRFRDCRRGWIYRRFVCAEKRRYVEAARGHC
jgi:hypothetical protein